MNKLHLLSSSQCWRVALLLLSLFIAPLANADLSRFFGGAIDPAEDGVTQSSLTDKSGFASDRPNWLSPEAPLPDVPDPEVAFKLSVNTLGANTLVVNFAIDDCCYLYEERMSFKSAKSYVQFAEPVFSEGKPYKDEFFGDMVIHRREAEARLPLLNRPDTAVEASIIVGYQGCSDAGICYPPQEKLLTFTLPPVSAGNDHLNSPNIAAEKANVQTYVSEQDRLSARLVSSGIWALPLFFGLGVLLAFTPCVFPMVPILSGIITADKHVTQMRGFVLSLTYVLAMALTYALFGTLAAATGANLQVAFQHPAVLVSFSLLFVVLALSMFGVYELQLPASLQSRLAAASNSQSRGRLASVAAMGVLSALIVGPCVAAPLIGVLSYITLTGDLGLGGLTLFVMGLGMGLPLLIIGTSAGHWLPKAGPWMNTIKAVFGVGLLAVAIWMLERILPPALTLLLWAALALGVSFAMIRRCHPERTVLRGTALSTGFTLFLYGLALIVGAANGARDPLRPLQTFNTTQVEHPEFLRVSGPSELDEQLTLSQADGKVLILDFYADWCISCKEMEKYTFSDSEVAAQLSSFRLVQADVTENNDADKALLQRFNLLGPPAILFFLPNGKEATPFRVMGFMQAEDFSSVLSQVGKGSANASLAESAIE